MAGRIRVAFVGKGGAGKSTIAGTFARLLARSGEPVLALDSDPLPGMPYALGIPVDDSPIPDGAVTENLPHRERSGGTANPGAAGRGGERSEDAANPARQADPARRADTVDRADLGDQADPDKQADSGGRAGGIVGPRWVLAPGLDADAVIDRWAQVCPDGVRYLQFGNLWGPIATLQRAQHAWSQVVREVDPGQWHLVGDLPGGTRQAMFGWARYASVVCVVVEPTAKSLHSARRLLNLSGASWAPDHLVVVANKVRDDADVARLADRLGPSTPVAVSIPEAPDVLAGDRRGAAPLDAAPHSPFVTAVKTLVAHVQNLPPPDHLGISPATGSASRSDMSARSTESDAAPSSTAPAAPGTSSPAAIGMRGSI